MQGEVTMARQLFDDYNEYRRKTGHIQQMKAQGKFIPNISKNHLREFESLALWCASQGVDPRRWLASLFESRRWRYPPKINQLKSVPHLQRYPKITSIPAYSARIQAEHQQAARESGAVFNRDLHLSHGAELLKRRYLAMGNTERCIADMDVETFGFHPKSEHCVRCPSAYQCAAILQSKVNYDVVAVRSGTIGFDQAVVAGLHGRS